MLPVYKEKIALWDWYEIESTGSTNDEIKRLVPSSGSSVALSAIRQTGGRGRRGRGWQEIEGNLYLTFSLNIPAAELSRYVCLIGLSLAETVKEIAPQSDVRIKWPNDVFLGGKKLSGILLENICGSLWAVGIGVNVAAAQAGHLQRAVGKLGDDLHVRARRDLGHDAAVDGVQVGLRKDLVGQHLAPVTHEGDGRFITGRFDRKNNHIVSASLRNQVMSNASSSGF